MQLQDIKDHLQQLVPAFLRKKWEFDVENATIRKFRLSELKKAAGGLKEDNLIGQGGFGLVYRGEGPDGEKWAIRRARQPSKEFKTEIETIQLAIHPNLIRTIGYCNEGKEQLLVFELAVNGNLKDAIHNRDPSLSFSTFVDICVGAANGLNFLHNGGEKALIHHNIKPKCILLGENFEAKVAGLTFLKAKSRDEMEEESSNVIGTMGYIDPCFLETRIDKPSIDVHSFGITLLEIVTSREVVTHHEQDGNCLKSWVQDTVNEPNATNFSVVSERFQRETEQRAALEEFVQLGMDCIQREDTLRPGMSEVLQCLQRIQQTLRQLELP